MRAPVCIAGMHRSGTSLAARMLNLAGLYLGAEDEMTPATPESPDGYWEHAGFVLLNDEILNELGGGWDHPPAAVDPHDGRLADIRTRAAVLLDSFSTFEHWGWKDPRTSLTFPFWNELVPTARMVLCLRNPLEVAMSLRRRGMFSFGLSLQLWETYNARALRSVDDPRLIVTRYEELITDPRRELARLVGLLEVQASDEAIDHACAVVDQTRRHHHFTDADLATMDVTPGVLRLYEELVARTERDDLGPISSVHLRVVEPPRPSGPPVNITAVRAELLRREVAWLRKEISGRDAVIERLESRLLELERDLADAIAALERSSKQLDEPDRRPDERERDVR